MGADGLDRTPALRGRTIHAGGADQAGQVRRFIRKGQQGSHQHAGVGVPRTIQHLLPAAVFNQAAGMHDADMGAHIRHHRQVVGDEDHTDVHILLEGSDGLQDLVLDDDIQGCGRFVGNDQRRVAGQRHGNDHPLAHAPGKLVGIILKPAFGDLHQVKQRSGPMGHGVAGQVRFMGNDGFGDLILDAVHRVECIHGRLEDHRDPAPADLPHARAADGGQILTFEAGLPGNDAGVGCQQPHECHPDGGFPASGFSHQSQRAAPFHLERDVVHRQLHAGGGPVADAQIFNFQQGGGHGLFSSFRSRGSSTSSMARPVM